MKKFKIMMLTFLLLPQNAQAGEIWETVKMLSSVLFFDAGIQVYQTPPDVSGGTRYRQWSYNPAGGLYYTANGRNREEEGKKYRETCNSGYSGILIARVPFFTIKREECYACKNINSLPCNISYTGTTVNLMVPDLILAAGLLSYGAWWWYKRKHAS